MDKKPFKSIYIHNGCRNSKVIPIAKKQSFITWLISFLNYKIQYLIDVNESLMDAEMLKASLYGPEYLKTISYAHSKLYIDINDVRIQMWYSITQIIINLAKKFKVYELSKPTISQGMQNTRNCS